LVGEIDLTTSNPVGLQVADQLPPQTLLDPLEFQWFTGYETRTARIFWDQYDLSNATFKTLHGFIPVQSILHLTSTPYNHVLVIGVHLMNTVVETGETPLLFEAFTSRDRPWTVSGNDVLVIKVTEDIPQDVTSSSQSGFAVSVESKIELTFGPNEVAYHAGFIFTIVRKLNLVPKEADLTHVTYGDRICIVQKFPILVEYSVKVHPQESGPTIALTRAFKLPWTREQRFL